MNWKVLLIVLTLMATALVLQKQFAPKPELPVEATVAVPEVAGEIQSMPAPVAEAVEPPQDAPQAAIEEEKPKDSSENAERSYEAPLNAPILTQ